MGLRHRCRQETLERRVCLTIESAVSAVGLDLDADLMSQSAAVAAASDGTSVSVYADRDQATGKGNDVWLRRFAADGSTKNASERVNTTLAGAQMNVDVATISAERYGVVWQSENQDGSGWGIYARIHTASGWSSEFLVNQTTAGAQVSPKIAVVGTNQYGITWVGRDDNGGNGLIYARRFSEGGVPASSELTVSSTGSVASTAPDIASTSGAVVVTWVSADLNNSSQTDIAYRFYNADLTAPTAAAGFVNTVTVGDQAQPAVAAVAGSSTDFTVVFSDTSAGGADAAVFARRISTTGASFAQFQVSQDSDGNRSRPQISAASGTTVIGWTQQITGETAASTMTRIFDANLTPVTNETPAGDGANARTLHGLAVTAQGSYREVSTLGEFTGYGIADSSAFNNVIALTGTSGNDTIVAYDYNGMIRTTVNGTSVNWSRGAFHHINVDLGDGNDTLIANDASMGASVSGGAGNDTITATSARDTISGDDGDDWIHCGPDSDYAIGNGGVDRIWGDDGNDTLTGGAGKDTMWGGFGNDRLSGSGSPDCLFGEDDDDRLYGQLGDDRCDGGGGKDRLYGDEGNDLLVGNSSNDRIYAGPGNDTLNGGKGNDYLEGDDGIDTVLAKEPGDTLVEIEIS